jgi:hypothetical protein
MKYLAVRRWPDRPACKRQFCVKVGTVPAMVSSMELHRSIGVAQKTAWCMLHRIRLALQAGSFSKGAVGVEVDETFIGQKHGIGTRPSEAGRSPMVVGVLERGGAANRSG